MGDFRSRLLGSASLLAAGTVGALMGASPALANPQNGTVASGNATISSTAPNTLQILQSSNQATINWQSFSIASGEKVVFVQPSSGSVALNRVTGSDPSAIFGTLTANGQVFLVNPNGIMFGPNSQIDVAGLVATTTNITDANFAVGKYAFTQASTNSSATVVNAGHISIRDAGFAALVAPGVQNSGVITAKLGKIALGGAKTFTLDFQGDGLLSFDASSIVTQAPRLADGTKLDALVVNTGQLSAEGGTVQISARELKSVVEHSINLGGEVVATSVGSQNGKIILSGGDSGIVQVDGTLNASGNGAGQSGGSVQVSGSQIVLSSTAQVDVSGQTGGGTAVIGADATGTLAGSVSVAYGAVIAADALGKGTGGAVSVLSQQSTSFAGAITAKGGADGGDGGTVDVSSHGQVALTGSVDLTAAKGQTGTFLLDPSTLNIIDGTASSGTQDSAASSGSLLVTVANNGANTITNGELQSLSGTTNIVLQATGLITISTSSLNLATTSGHGLTIVSTVSGGIVFTSAATQITTQGGSITLEALGGGALVNVGKLTSNGGAITLTSGSDLQLANTVNAGAGTATVTSLAGSIINLGSGSVTGSAVTLAAANGNVGSSSAAIAATTPILTVQSGGNIYAGSTLQLTSLTVDHSHVVPNTTDVFQITAPSLTFSVTDAASSYNVAAITQSGLALSFTGDYTLSIGAINVGTAAASLTSTAGNIVNAGSAATAITAGALTLTAQGAAGTDGAVGTSTLPLTTTIGSLTLTAGWGGVYVTNSGALTLTALTATGTGVITATTGNITTGTINNGSGDLTLTATAGSILNSGIATTSITADTLSLNALGGSVGTQDHFITFNANTFNANAASGGIYANAASGVTFNTLTSTNGPITLTSAGTTFVSSIVSSGTNAVSITTTGGDLYVNTINAGTQAGVTLTTSAGSIYGGDYLNGGTITANALTATTPTTGYYGVLRMETAANTITVTTGYYGVSIKQAGSVTLSSITTGGSISLTAMSGSITVGSLTAGSSVGLVALAGNIVDDGTVSTVITGSSVTLSALQGYIGTSSAHIGTSASGLELSSGGNIYLDNSATVTSLTITDNHLTAGVVNVLAVTSPYLTFTVTDSGSQFTLSKIIGQALTSLSFTGDEDLVLGHIQASVGWVSLASTNGNVVYDGVAGDVVTGSSVQISTSTGYIGTALAPIAVNTSVLSLKTRGNLYVSDITDLYTLNITSAHGVSTANYNYVVTAPSLVFSVTDSANGYLLSSVSDITSLNFTFTGDRTITAGAIDVTNSGSVTLTSTAGSILDDGNASTLIVGSSVSLNGYGGSVGVAGASGYMDVVAGTLTGNAGNGGFYVTVPKPTTNNTGYVLLESISATGAIVLTVTNGDAHLGSISTSGGTPVTISALNGSLYNGYGNVSAHASTITLSASGAIGTAASPVLISSSLGVAVTATASGGGLYLTGSGPTTLTSLTSAGPMTITISYGDATLGAISAGAHALSISASNGNLIDDGSTSTSLTGSTVSLSSYGTVGTSVAPIAVNTTGLTIVAGGNIFVTDSIALTALALSQNATSVATTYSVTTTANQSFSITDDGTTTYLQTVAGASPLTSFSFAGQDAIKVGAITTTAGTVTLSTAAGNIVGDGTNHITASTVSLSTASGSIGATGAGNAIALTGTSGLTVSASGNIYVTSDTALTSLAITSNSTAATANVFAITAGSGATSVTISDNGAYVQDVSAVNGTGLSNFSFTSEKNISVGTISATGAVQLNTSGGGAHGDAITKDSSGTGISAGSLVLSAISGYNDTALSTIGTSAAHLAVSTPSITVTGTGAFYITDAQALTTLSITQTHRADSSTGSYNPYGVSNAQVISASGDSFSLSDGSAVAVTASGLAFNYTTDRAITVGTLNVGAGSVTLTSSNNSGYYDQPIITGGDGNLITAASVSLNAGSYLGNIGALGTVNVSTANLTLVSANSIAVSDNIALSSLSITANHNGSSYYNSYSISATGLTFSVSDSSYFYLTNIANTGTLALSFSSDRELMVETINAGAAGSVTLASSQGILNDGNTSTKITANSLTLNSTGYGTVTAGYPLNSSYGPLDTAVNYLYANLSGSLYVSNTGSLLSDGTHTITAPSVTLIVAGTGAELGSSAQPLLINTQNLSLTGPKDIYVSNLTDLYSLNVTNTHGAAGTNIVQVGAPNLTFSVTNTGGTLYDIANVSDLTGIDFTFSGDQPVQLGIINAGAGRSIAVTSTGGDITADPTLALTADAVSLTASAGSIGTSGTHIVTNALNLSLITDLNAYVDNTVDLTRLSFTSYQSGATVPVYSVTAPALTFAVTDNGTTTTATNVTDTTGITFVLDVVHPLNVVTIDAQTSGQATVISSGTITGSGVSTERITAANITLGSSNQGVDLGSSADPIFVSSPVLNINNRGNVYVSSDTHIDTLSIYQVHPSSTYFAWALTSPGLTFNATDSASGTDLSATDTTDGLAFSFSGDHNILVGAINLGTTGTVTLGGGSYSGVNILGDGTASSAITAGSLSITTDTGNIGGSGANQAINATTATFSGYTDGGSATLAFNGATTLSSLTSRGPLTITNSVGDIALGYITVYGYAVSITNTGGSILSGTLESVTSVNLVAAGSIGNNSAIQTYNTSGSGGTTTLTASATGSVAVSETGSLNVSSVTAGGAVNLTAGYAVSLGTINATTANPVTVTANQGSITGNSGSNLITASAVTLNAAGTNASSYSIGASGTSINLSTPVLTLNARGNLYIADSADLSALTITRSSSYLGSPGGTLQITAANLTWSVTDTGAVTYINTLTDTTGLNFSLTTYDAIEVQTLNVGTSSVSLTSAPYSTDGSITAYTSNPSGIVVAPGTIGVSLITAGNLTLTTGYYNGTTGKIGTSASPLALAVSSVTATTQEGGLYLAQSGALTLSNLSSGGALSVSASSGNLTIGTLTYGDGYALSLTAAGGSILGSSSTVIYGGSANNGGTYGAITLSALNGIGTSSTPITISAPNGNVVSVSVTGTGSAYIASNTDLPGGLSVSAANGSVNVTSSGGTLVLTNLTSATDGASNGVTVTATDGNLNIGTIAAGTTSGTATLTASAGTITDVNSSSSITAYNVTLNGAYGIGTSALPVTATSPQLSATTNGSDMYLSPTGVTVLSYIVSKGGLINVTSSANLLAGYLTSSGGDITLSTSGAGAVLTAGNIQAGSGNVSLSAPSGTIEDDGIAYTRIVGSGVTLAAANGIGTSAQPVQTTATSITATTTAAGPISIADNDTSGVTLTSITAANGPVLVTTAGPTIITNITSTTDATANTVSVTDSTGNITLYGINAGTTNGAVTLNASAGSIRYGGVNPGNSTANIVANQVTLNASSGIGTLTNVATGAGAPITLSVSTIDGLTITGTNSVINVTGVGNLTLGSGAVTVPASGSAFISATGNLDASSGPSLASGGSLALYAGGTLTVPSGAWSEGSTLYLTGVTDVVASGGGRTLTITANALTFTSGAAGGATVLDTTSGTLSATLSGAGALTVNNTGALSLSAHTNSGLVAATSSGSLTVGTITAGGNDAISLTSTSGSLLGASTNLTGSALNLVSATGIGSSAQPFSSAIGAISAQVTGTGGLYLAPTGSAILGALSTANGAISVTAAGNLTETNTVTAVGGPVSLVSTGGNVVVGTLSTTGSVSLQGNTVTLDGDVTTGALTVTGNAVLGAARTVNTSADNGTVDVTGTLNGGGYGLIVNAGTGNVVLGGAATNLASLTATGGTINVAAVTTSGAQSYNGITTVGGDLTAGSLVFADALTLTGARILDTSAQNGAMTFDGVVTALSSLALNSGTGTVMFAPTANLTVGGNLIQTGAGLIDLPNVIIVTPGDLTFAAPATITNAASTITVDGKITMTGLYGPNTAFTISDGGGMLIGVANGGAGQIANLASLSVPASGPAKLYGFLGGTSGSTPATMVNSPLVGPPWYYNDDPWGPISVQFTVPTQVTIRVQVLTTGGTNFSMDAYRQPSVVSFGDATGGLGAGAQPSVLSTGQGPSSLGAGQQPSVLGTGQQPAVLGAPSVTGTGASQPASDPQASGGASQTGTSDPSGTSGGSGTDLRRK